MNANFALVQVEARTWPNLAPFMDDLAAEAPTDTDGDPLVCLAGQIFGGYEIVRFMTNGGTCQIFEAKHAIMQRRVVIKVQKAHLRANTKRAHRIATEAMALAHIDHPNVVKVYHCDVDPRVGIYIVQEYLEGRDLRETLIALNKTGRRLALKVAAAITLEVADALAAFHAINILHRDIKPENIFIVSNKTGKNDGGSVKLLDLGIAKMPDGVAKTTDKNVAPGTVPYMAAEQLADGKASSQSDIFSLALVFDEMLSGQHAFAPPNLAPGNREMVARTRILHGLYKSLEERGLDAPAALVAFLARCLAVNPAERPATMVAFAAELRAVVRVIVAESGPNEAVTALPEPAQPVEAFGTPKHTDRMRERPNTDTSRGLPPFACELSAPLSCASLILTEAPGAWRFMRIPLPIERSPTLVFRGILQLGKDSDIPIPGLAPMSIHEDFEGELQLNGGHSKRTRKGALKPYEFFQAAGYTFQFVPPTPEGLGIPPDYETITTDKAAALDVPSLMVRGGHKSVLGRKFPLRSFRVRIGGRVDLEVPLFRSQVPVAASLSWDPLVGEFRVRVEQKGSKVHVHSAREDEGLLGPLGMIEVDGWQLVLLPPDPRSRT